MSLPIGSLVQNALALANALVDARTVTLTRLSQGTYDPVLRRPGTSASATYATTAVVVPFLPGRDSGMVPPGALLQQSRRVVMASEGLAVVPAANDRVTFDGADWNVVGVSVTAGNYQMVVTR